RLARRGGDLERALHVACKESARDARGDIAESGQTRIIACRATVLEPEHGPGPNSTPTQRRDTDAERSDKEAIPVVDGEERHQARALPARARVPWNGRQACAHSGSPACRARCQPLLLQRLVRERLLRPAESRRKDGDGQQQDCPGTESPQNS